jgi:hypothetical protein
MINATALGTLPSGLRDPLIAEYQSIIQNYSEHRWLPSELCGGRFCEIVYTILEGYASKSYAPSPAKPVDFAGACRKLEQNLAAPRSFRFSIPRLLTALYEVRNNRGVGHVSGEINSNHMDATFVITSCNWVMAELVRVYHNLTTDRAQRLVDNLVERRIPLVWQGEDMRRVLDPGMKLREQVLVLMATAAGSISVLDLLKWTDYENTSYFKKMLRELHAERLIELSETDGLVVILPPGSAKATKIVQQYSAHLAE